MLFWELIMLAVLEALSSLGGNFSTSKEGPTISRHCNGGHLRTTMGSAFNPILMMDHMDEITEDEKRTKVLAKLDKHSKPPWTCATSYHWIDLGMDYYPRFIRTSVCPPVNCWFGMFTCKGKPYRMTILHRMKSNMTEPEVTDDPCVVLPHHDWPADSSRVWEFKTIEVSLCCSCTL